MGRRAELEALKAAIEDALLRFLPERSAIAQALLDAMRYATLGGGKRFRPLLTCAACTAFGGRAEDALAPACALEFIHAYSLVHDDLPAMDDAALRRGAPSCHALHGEALAILAGDALQTLAFSTLARSSASAGTRLAAIGVLAEASGWRGMAGGQCFDLANVGRALTLSELQALHGAKTGALIAAAVRLGALFANADAQSQALAEEFGGRVGLAFQIMDDVLDVIGDSAALGKSAKADEKAGKSTFAAVLGVEAARAKAQALLAEAQALLRDGGLQDSLLAQLGNQAVNRSH